MGWFDKNSKKVIKDTPKSLNEFHAVAKHWIHLQKVYSDGIELKDDLTIRQVETMLTQKCASEGLDVKSCVLLFDDNKYQLELVIFHEGSDQKFIG